MRPLVMTLLSLMVAYCGQQGPLYLPPEPSDSQQATNVSAR